MATTYTGGADADEKQLRRALREWHEELVKEKIQVALIMAHPDLDQNGMPKSPPIKHAGHGVVAKVQLVSCRDFLLMHKDVIIEIDAWRWADLSGAKRLALLDHELTHVELVRDSDGNVRHHRRPGSPGMQDTLGGRPMLRLVKDDWYLTGFAEVIKRHGENALEAESLKTLGLKLRQMDLPGFVSAA